MRQRCGERANFRLVGPDDIDELDLRLHPGWRSLAEPAHRADCLRVALLEKYGGLWLDSDVITLRSYRPVLRLLEDIDFVGWEYRSGTNGEETTYRVSMGALAARKRIPLMIEWLSAINAALEHGPESSRTTWHSLGRHIMNPLLRDMVEAKEMTYLPLHAEASTLPIKAKQRARFFETDSIQPLVKDDHLQTHISYFNSWMPDMDARTEEQILGGDAIIDKLFQFALLPERRDDLVPGWTEMQPKPTKAGRVRAAVERRASASARRVLGQ